MREPRNPLDRVDLITAAAAWDEALDAAVAAALRATHGPPSTRERQPTAGLQLPEPYTERDRAAHNLGCLDAVRAIRALPNPYRRKL